jgi:hypothetical protein
VPLDCFDEYEKLLANFASLQSQAAEMTDALNDEFVTIARVGFSVHGKPDAWDKRHVKIINDYVNECEAQGDSNRVRQFYALAHGMILGAYSSGLLEEDSYRKAWILLPGFVMGKTRDIET